MVNTDCQARGGYESRICSWHQTKAQGREICRQPVGKDRQLWSWPTNSSLEPGLHLLLVILLSQFTVSYLLVHLDLHLYSFHLDRPSRWTMSPAFLLIHDSLPTIVAPSAGTIVAPFWSHWPPGSGPKVAMELEEGHVIFESLGWSLPKGSTYNLRHQFQGHLVRALEERSLPAAGNPWMNCTIPLNHQVIAELSSYSHLLWPMFLPDSWWYFSDGSMNMLFRAVTACS